MNLDKNFFVVQKFNQKELTKRKQSAKRDLDIALKSNEPEVQFHFGYMALLKIAIYCLAKEGYRAKSRPGHHQKIIESLADIMEIEDIVVIGDKMRKDRNLDLYSADTVHSLEEIREYLEFIQGLYSKL